MPNVFHLSDSAIGVRLALHTYPENYILSRQVTTTIMLTRVNHNLRKHLSTPALGPVKPQLEGLANKTKDVAETCQKFFAVSSRWRHQMEAFSALLAFCAGNSPVTGEFPTQRPVIYDAELWYFHSSAPEPRVGQTMETPVIWDTIVPIMTSQWCHICIINKSPYFEINVSQHQQGSSNMADECYLPLYCQGHFF